MRARNKPVKRSLYECANARVKIDRIYCAKGHKLSIASKDGMLNIERLQRGEPLELSICQDCPDFDSMGGLVPKEDRGWAGAETPKSNKKGRKRH